ncbi:hypothetical protein PIB30_038551 [Stylosanthes scabra]|uniref:Uncharacterized protein n=1 Tax=Stylosanthes scabra TaxID=79078 RepID=A0ABU6XFD4_9FABA|nr:hypothetical protein [Stylosanthes scabra]
MQQEANSSHMLTIVYITLTKPSNILQANRSHIVLGLKYTKSPTMGKGIKVSFGHKCIDTFTKYHGCKNRTGHQTDQPMESLGHRFNRGVTGRGYATVEAVRRRRGRGREDNGIPTEKLCDGGLTTVEARICLKLGDGGSNAKVAEETRRREETMRCRVRATAPKWRRRGRATARGDGSKADERGSRRW